jgi:malonyl-CoA O-methyltransferase
MTLTYEIIKVFNQHAAEYELAAKAQQEIGKRLLERLYYLKISPQRILDVGCGPGFFSRELALMYPKAQIVGLDLAQLMLVEARKKYSWRRKWPLVVGDMNAMPFITGTFDLVFANQTIHWGGTLSQVFRELNRVMKPNGCLMFTTLGPDTFKELRAAWASVNDYAHVNEFPDMHDVGDCLMFECFLEPVMDMELLSVHYNSLNSLLKSLKAQGVKNINAERNQGLTGKKSWKKFEQNYLELRTESGKFSLTYEVIYGHAWKGERRRMVKGTETMIPVSQIIRSQS